MAGGWMGRRLALMVVAGLVCGIGLASVAYAQGQEELTQLIAEVSQLYSQRKYAEAIPIAERAVALARKRHGEEHPELATAISWLADLYQEQGRYAEAEPYYKRSLAIYEKALGPDDIDVAWALHSLAGLYQAQGRYAEAEPLYKRDIAISEKVQGREHPDVATSLNSLAGLYQAQGRYAEAEPLYKRSLAIREKVMGQDHTEVAASLHSLAGLYQAQGRYAEAEPLYKRDLAISEKMQGREHPDVATSLNSLAGLYQAQGRYAVAEPLYKRSLAIREKVLGPDHTDVAATLNGLAALYYRQGRYAEAEPLYKRDLAISEKMQGLEHPDVAISLNNLAALYQAQGRYAEAQPLYKRSLAIGEKVLGPDHPDVGTRLNNLAALYQAQARYAEAEPLYKRSLAIGEKVLGADHPDVGAWLNNLATLAFLQSDWTAAADYWRRSTGLIKRRAEGGLAGGLGEASEGEARRLAWQFWGLVRATYRLALQSPSATLADEMFETAQWAASSAAAASLAQMAARSARGSPGLAGLVRERQDLVSEWQVKDQLLIAAKGEAPAKRSADAEKALADRLAAIDARLAKIDYQLKAEFPDYAALASSAPVSVTEVQAQLGPDEALVLLLDTPEWTPLPEETFIWIVTKSDMRWARADMGTAMLAREVAALRCGLDATAWDGDGLEKCAKAFDTPLDRAPGPNEPLPFDHARAHKLYGALLSEVRDLIKGKHLLIVPSGPLTQFPFHVLVTSPPTSRDHRATAWLAREHPITILPAVSSLKALRRVGRPSAAPRPMIGFGNPLLDGPDARFASLAKLARQKQRCPELRQHLAARSDRRTAPLRVEARGGLANVSVIKAQVPLPETADELCAVAHDVKAVAARDIRLGAKATEREVKRFSASGELAKYRIVHFATHGILAGKLDGADEPGLILTPPSKATEEDDGYLSASEIAALKLDADLVILSACNTAAGAATSAEALSGLARAFIYAQARALLVSHWEVYSDAAVKLITTTVREMARDPKVGRSEALRRSMLALVDNGAPDEAHPAYWAPFVVVGEGAATR